MKKYSAWFLTLLTVGVLITSCSFPFGKQVDGTSGSQPDATEAGAIPASTDPNLSPIDLGGPPAGTPMVWLDGSILVHVPGSEFIMGGEGTDNPQHKLGLSSFWIYRTKVTNRMYAYCVANGKCELPKDEQALKDYKNPLLRDVPVVGVDWQQSDSYCKFVEGRLPTEAEWEKTARGPDGNIYPWGNGEPTCDLLNFNGTCVGKTSEVFDYPNGRSFYTALDMQGNTFEWVGDWYDPNYYGASPVVNPIGPEIGTVRSVRSSSFQSDISQTPAYRRFYLDPITHRPDLGFRCVVENPRPFAPLCAGLFVPGQIGDEPIGGQVPDKSNCQLPSFDPSPGDCLHQDPDDAKQTGSGGGKFSSSVISVNPQSGFDCTMQSTTLSCVGHDNESVDVEYCVECENPKYGPGGDCSIGQYYEGACVGEGTPGECPPGYQYDNVNLCCTAGAGIPAIGCGPGEILENGQCTTGVSSPPGQICGFVTIGTGKCNDPALQTTPGAGGRTCRSITSADACKISGCTWSVSTAFPTGICE